mgnify:CR=1 FL=1
MMDQCEAQVALVLATPLYPKQVFAVALGVDSASTTYALHTTIEDLIIISFLTISLVYQCRSINSDWLSGHVPTGLLLM